MTTPHDLKNIGLKATLPRLKILDLFENSDVRHLTAEDVYKMLMKEGMEIGLATIYRVLTQFEQAGILIRHHFLVHVVPLLDVDLVGCQHATGEQGGQKPE